jgi:hypothetical protein
LSELQAYPEIHEPREEHIALNAEHAASSAR